MALENGMLAPDFELPNQLFLAKKALDELLHDQDRA